MARLTNAQKKEIIARYIAGESKNSIAKSFNVSHTAISKILSSEKVSESFKEADIETTMSMIAFIESQTGTVQDLMREMLNSLKAKLKKASFKDCVTAYKDFAALYTERERIKAGEAKDGAETRTIEFVFTDTSISNERESNDTKDI